MTTSDSLQLVYFSNVTEFTHRFIGRLSDVGFPPAAGAIRIPIRGDIPLLPGAAYIVIVTPTYGGGANRGGEVPKQVIRFLNHPEHRHRLRGVIGSGNTNFGADFAKAADIIATRCNVPVIAKFELSGTPDDIDRIAQKVEKHQWV